MFGWVDKLFAAIYQRGRGLTEVSDRVADEKRIALRAVRDAVRDAMVAAEQDRDHGRDSDRSAAMASAQLASSTVQEVHDDDARALVEDWFGKFDRIRKGWKEGSDGYRQKPPGYPEPAWSELKQAADAAKARLGELLRDLMKT